MGLNGRVADALASVTDSSSFLGEWALYRAIADFDPPRDESLWAFGAQGGAAFTDNAKYLYLHVAAECPDVRAVWLSKDSAVVGELQRAGFEAYHCYSPRGLRATLRAGVVFLTQGHRDLAMPATAGAFAVLLWHGVPLKRISWDAGFRDLPKLVQRAHADMADEFDLLTVPGEGVVDQFSSGLRIDRERMALTGYPRNDALFGAIPSEEVGADAVALARIRTLAADRRLVFYLPTFREWTDESVRDRLDLPALDSLLAERDATLVVKTHPRDRLDLPEDLSHVVALPAATDVYPFLRHADALVTDYSSVYFDYLLLDRPIVFYADDLAAYRDHRGFYFDYESVTPGPVADSFDELLAGLDAALGGTDAHANDRAAVRARLLGADPAARESTDGSEGGDSGVVADCAPAAPRSAAVVALVRRRLAESETRREKPSEGVRLRNL